MRNKVGKVVADGRGKAMAKNVLSLAPGESYSPEARISPERHTRALQISSMLIRRFRHMFKRRAAAEKETPGYG